MNNNFYTEENSKTNAKKISKNKLISIVILSVMIMGIVLFGILLIEDSKKTIYQNGQVEILDKTIQLPCNIDTFKNMLNAEMLSFSDDNFNKVRITNSNNLELVFYVYITDMEVTGILIPEESSNYLKAKIKFPGDVSFYTPINEINDKYKTSPFNINYENSKGSFGYDKEIRYRNDEWEIFFYMSEDEIKEIQYHYLGYDY